MNHSSQYAPNKYYPIYTDNVRTDNEVEPPVIVFTDEIQLQELPDDPGNTHIVSTDAFGTLAKLPISSLPPPSPPVISLIASNIAHPNRLLSQDSTDTINESLAYTNYAGDIVSPGIVMADSAEFNALSVGPQSVPPASNTRSQLKITSDPGDLGGFPKDNLGSRVELYNNNNQYPLVSLSAFDENDNSLAFGEYGGSTSPWIKSGISFFKWQRFNDQLYLMTNNDLSPAGSAAAEKVILKYVNTGLDTKIEFHKPVKLFSTTTGPTNTRFLTLNNATDEIEERPLPAFGTGNVDWIGGVSVDNSVARFDGITGLIIQDSGVIIDDLNNISVNSVNTGQGNNLLYSMDQDVLSTSNVTHNRLFVTDFIQSDSIQETTLDHGCDITTWNVQSQKMKSSGQVSTTSPMTFQLGYTADAQSPIGIIASGYDNNGILFDMNHADTFTANDFISGDINGNAYIHKNSGNLDFKFSNGVVKGGSLPLNSMNTTMSLSKTGIGLNEVVICQEAVIMKGLTLDPETQPETVLLTLSSLAVNEVYKRPYQSVYGTAIGTSTPLIVALPIIDDWVSPNLSYGMTLARNCSPVGNTITVDAGIDSFIGSIDYAIAYASGSNSTIEYEFAIRINGFIATGSLMSTVLKSADERHNISCHFVFPVDALDTIEIVLKNPLTTEQIVVHNMSLTIQKVFI